MPKLLIVEDREMSKDMLIKSIESWNLFHPMDWVDSAEGALEKLSSAERQGQPYDCLLLDLFIWDLKPKANGERKVGDEASPFHGIKVLEACIDQYRQKTLIFSAHVDRVQTQLSQLNALDLLLPRPVFQDLLREKLEQIVGKIP